MNIFLRVAAISLALAASISADVSFQKATSIEEMDATDPGDYLAAGSGGGGGSGVDGLLIVADDLLAVNDVHRDLDAMFRIETKPPTTRPTTRPTYRPPTKYPTRVPTAYRPPTKYPTRVPTTYKPPTRSPVYTRYPTRYPTAKLSTPTKYPVYTRYPTKYPVYTRYPTYKSPTRYPVYTRYPTRVPTTYKSPTRYPVYTRYPTKYPVYTRYPTKYPVYTRFPTKYPVYTRYPTRYPTTYKSPTRYPVYTRYPTRYPTAKLSTPTTPPTGKPTKPPPQCGTLKTKAGLALGPYEKNELSSKAIMCNNKKGTWYTRSFVPPAYIYQFRLTQTCEYQYSAPENKEEWKTVSDVNSWFAVAAKKFQRPGHNGYKASADNVIFSGLSVPKKEHVIYTNIKECPEAYCVKVIGPAVAFTFNSTKPAELLYAFSNKDAHKDFYSMLYGAANSQNKRQLFLTNHFVRCGCKSFCADDKVVTTQAQATCYVEDRCGVRNYQITYSEDYPNSQKALWAKNGTTKAMHWYDACATAMFGCKLGKKSYQLNSYTGPPTYYSTYPKSYKLTSWEGDRNIFGLGGGYYVGFPISSGTSGYKIQKPYVYWSCPNMDAVAKLDKYYTRVQYAGLMQDTGGGLKSILPKVPCEPENITKPEPVPLGGKGPSCDRVKHKGFCFQMQGGTCYIREPTTTCSDVEFVYASNSATNVTDDVNVWFESCILSGAGLVDRFQNRAPGKFTYAGAPAVYPYRNQPSGWTFTLSYFYIGGKKTMTEASYYKGDTWTQIYSAKNFTKAASSSSSGFNNTYGNLFTVAPKKCTPKPTGTPSVSPTMSVQPSNYPTMSPTICSESYLDSENLNINLAVDLSFSTYEKLFTSEPAIGDVNGDGKANTILDAQVVAIEDLLKSIDASETLNNKNCEINLISFETDAKAHGTWQPLHTSGKGINNNLLSYVKKKMRAPTSKNEVYQTNNGFTNFDAALDLSVEYFSKNATANRLNLLVFLSDGEPNVRGDGDDEMYCADTAKVWFAQGDEPKEVTCSDLNLEPGQRHEICRGNDSKCVPKQKYQDCVRGPSKCMNSNAATQYTSELAALDELNVERLAIGVGDESNVTSGSALWMIDNNPGKNLGVLPVQALDLQALSNALKSLCILNTDPPTKTPSTMPSFKPTVSAAPSASPSATPSQSPTIRPTPKPIPAKFYVVTPDPTASPSSDPTSTPTFHPSAFPSSEPSTSEPTYFPTSTPTGFPTSFPTSFPTVSPTALPTDMPSSYPSSAPTSTPSQSPSGSFFPSSAPTDGPTTSPAPSVDPTQYPSEFPTNNPTDLPSSFPTAGPTATPSSFPTASPTSSPSAFPSTDPTGFPTASPTTYPSFSPTTTSHPTFLLPDCYDGPKLIKRDSSNHEMCYFNHDMVQINNMNNTEVTIQINNVWTANALPEQLRVFVHSNGVDSVQNNGDGFQCLNEDGDDRDVEGENELVVKCYQEDENEPWLAVVDVIISDPGIGDNTVPHPCFPERAPIAEACSWRLVVPCDSEELCSSEPTDSPTSFPTSFPSQARSNVPSNVRSNVPTVSTTEVPTFSPSVSTTEVPTFSPSVYTTEVPTFSPSVSTTEVPTFSPSVSTTEVPSFSPPTVSAIEGPSFSPTVSTTFGEEVFRGPPPTKPPTDSRFGGECKGDIVLMKTEGVTKLPSDSISIISQDTTTVTVALKQAFTSSGNGTAIDSMYYQYHKDEFDQKCYEDEDVAGGQTTTITIHCTHRSQVALLDLWIADALDHNVLSELDNVVIPECCHATNPKGTPVSKYLIEFKCVSECAGQTQK